MSNFDNLLSDEEIKQARDVIARAMPGTYKLKQLYGENWEEIDHKTGFGTQFKATVMAGKLPSIEFSYTGSDNNARYKVNGG